MFSQPAALDASIAALLLVASHACAAACPLQPTWEAVQEAVNQPLSFVLVNALLLRNSHAQQSTTSQLLGVHCR
jgi:hypothetical protein